MDVARARPISGSRPAWCGLLAACVLLPGCAHYIGTTAGSFLRNVRESDDPNIRNQAYLRLADPGCYTSDEQKAQAIAVMSEQLASGREPTATRAQICRTLGALGRPEARLAILKAVEDPEPLVRVEACRALAKVAAPEDAAVLSRVMSADQDSACRVAAIEALGTLETNDPRLIIQLADGMEHGDPAIRLASYRAVKELTGKEFGPDASAYRALAPGATDEAVIVHGPAEPLPRR